MDFARNLFLVFLLIPTLVFAEYKAVVDEDLDYYEAGGSGDVTSVGDCASGACFDGTQGTILTFNNAGGDGTLSYDGTNFSLTHNFIIAQDKKLGFTFNELTKYLYYDSTTHDFTFTDDVDIKDYDSSHLRLWNTVDDVSYGIYNHDSSWDYPGLTFWKEAAGVVGDDFPLLWFDLSRNMYVNGVLYSSGSMTYPGAGIALSTGSAWEASITNNSANWNTAYGWGNHASAGYQSALVNSAGLLAALSDETGTGLAVFGTSPTIATPLLTLQDGNGAAPTTDGQLKYDRTAETLQIGDGAATYIMGAKVKSRSFVIKSPVVADDFPLFMVPRAMTITGIYAIATGGTNVVGGLWEYASDWTTSQAQIDSGDWTITASAFTDTTISTNATLDASDVLWWKTTTVSGTVNFLTVTIYYTE